MARAPGSVRDEIVAYLKSKPNGAHISEISEAVTTKLGTVAPSSVRSYLNLNVPEKFQRVGKGQYRLKQ